jgi:hypothetical protein
MNPMVFGKSIHDAFHRIFIGCDWGFMAKVFLPYMRLLFSHFVSLIKNGCAVMPSRHGDVGKTLRRATTGPRAAFTDAASKGALRRGG